jgi:serine/threonine protein kinase
MGLSAGTHLGPYEIVAPLGVGGMGQVYRARDPRLGREVAVKVLPEPVAKDPERLRRTAERAREMGSDAFTTTLLGSPHQDHELLRESGERAAEEVGVSFLYRDFRPLHERSHEAARRRQLYLQPYCGCCFSEYERFRDTGRELYRGGGPKKAE